MPYCPICKEAFDDASECPNDHSKLPYQTVPGRNTTWMEIASTGTDDEARLVKGFLDAEGIRAEIENVKFSMEPTNFGKMGDIRVYVAADDEERALALLRQRNDEYDKLDDDDDTLVTDEGVAEIDDDASTEPE